MSAEVRLTRDEYDALRDRLDTAEETLRAIRDGEVDGLVVNSPYGEQIFTLKGAEHPYRVMVEAMEEGAATLSPDGVICYCNKRFAALLRTPHAQVLGSSLAAFLAQECQPDFTCLSSGCRDGEPARGEVTFRAPDGTLIPVSVSCSALPDSDHLCLVAMDLTARKAAEATILRQNAELEARVAARTAELEQANAALRVSEARFRSVLENSRDVIYRLNLQTDRYEYISPAVASVVGYTAEELAALDRESTSAMIHPDDRPAMGQALARLEASGQANAEYRQRAKDGGYRWLANRMALTRDAGGRPLFRDGSIRDVTDRKQAEEALLREHAFLEAAIAGLPQALAFFDPRGQIVLANPAARALLTRLGIGEEEKGHFLDPRTYAPVPLACQPMMRALLGEVVHGDEFLLVLPDAPPMPVLVSAAPIRLLGDIVAAVSAIEDITALKEADSAKDEFLAVLSHELQTPLTNMLGWSAEALEVGSPELMAQAMEVVHRNALRQKRLVEDILDMSRLIHRKIELQPELIDLHAQACQAMENVRHAAAERRLQLACEPFDEPLPIHADPVRLQQCIGNLLHNSLKFTPAGGTITVRCRRDGARASLAIIDTGRGIAPAALPTLFQVFRQVDRNERHGGLGLGLAVTHGIVQLHGGDIRAESAGLDQGSTFTLTLPIAEP